MRGNRHFLSSAGLFNGRNLRGRNSRPIDRASASKFEALERRAMLTADIAVANFSADGTNLLVDYDISGANVSAFNISIYRSTNGTSLDTLLQTQRMTASADLQVGTAHRATFAPSFSDTDGDYFLVAVVDASGEISESSESNNQTMFSGGVFLATNGLLHVHGSSSGDMIVVNEASTFNVTLNSTVYSHATSAVAGVRIRSHDGSDYVHAIGTAKPQLICGGNGTDVLVGGSGNDTILGGDGDDTIYGLAGHDLLLGENGNDFIFGGDGNDNLYGNAGNDTIFAGAGGDTLDGGDGDDWLYGEADNDLIVGGAGDDVLDGGTGNDTYRFWGNYDLGTDMIAETAGNGTDTLDFTGVIDSSLQMSLLNTGTTAYDVTAFLHLVISNENAVENVKGTSQADTIFGNNLSNVIEGFGGDDWIYGGQGNDVHYGGDGADHVYGDDGNDTIYGGAGGDTLYGNNGDCDCADNDSDTIYGEDGNDFIYGEGGFDYLYGGLGNDYLNGGPGMDFMYGGGQFYDIFADRPVIHMDAIIVGEYYQVYGYVEDDQTFDGETVHLGGVFSGYSATVDENGQFEILIPIEEIGSGEGSATFIDGEGLASNEATIEI